MYFLIFAFWILLSWSCKLIHYGNTFCYFSQLQIYYTYYCINMVYYYIALQNLLFIFLR